MNALPPAATGLPRIGEIPAWRSLLRQSAGHLAAWTDQAVVSGTALVALVLLGRWSGADQLGAYALAASILALVLAAQDALITRPYSIQLGQLPGSPAEHAFSSLVLSGLLSIVSVGALIAVALALTAGASHHAVLAILWTLAGAVPFVLLREYARRFAFAHFKMLHALLIDGAVAAVNLVLLGWLGWTNRLSAVSAVAALGVSCAIGSVGWLFVVRCEFAPGFARLRSTLSASWALGKWLLAGQLALQVQGYVAHWLALLLAGASVTGIYAACMSVISFANPVLFGFFNVLTPKAVRAFRSQGANGLRRQAALDSLLLAALMGSFCLLIAVVGEAVLTLLYPSAEYRGNGTLLVILAFAVLAGSIGVPASIALASAGRTGAVAAVMVGTASFHIALTWMMMLRWGLLGAAWALLIAEAIGSIGRWITFLMLVSVDTKRDADSCKPARA